MIKKRKRNVLALILVHLVHLQGPGHQDQGLVHAPIPVLHLVHVLDLPKGIVVLHEERGVQPLNPKH